MAVRQATLADVLTFHVAGGVAVNDTLTRGAREKMASPALQHVQDRTKIGTVVNVVQSMVVGRGTAVDGREVWSDGASNTLCVVGRGFRHAGHATGRELLIDHQQAEPAVPGETMRPSNAAARRLLFHLFDTTLQHHRGWPILGLLGYRAVVDGLSNLLLVLEDVITQRLGRGPPRRRCAHGGQKHFLIALDEVIDDALRVHQFVGRAAASTSRTLEGRARPARWPWRDTRETHGIRASGAR